ncbi:LTA synthase family protein [Christiangramia sp. SM2212]|uniref:Sulfatase-like hydrolase/transferase n=1 Tax=Christiangramia sediminicola TaxID=3073267 RepID=A0ABU1EPD6_9FLAO|nr:sulfatase-like hydrolase/transferase [Christiangramia sp. SM2212]MDR5589892.1 sulfatase-like hydrolase/transferase [Christiangramia sp. SM2212]
MTSKTKTLKPGFSFSLRNSAKQFVGLAIIFLVFLFLLSGIEVMLGMMNHSVENSFAELFMWSCFEDLKFFFTWLFPVYIIFLVFYFLIPKLVKSIFIIFSTLFFLGQLVLIFYYNTTLLMLGSDLFGYSIDEIMQTVGASGSLSITPILTFVLVISALIFSLVILSKRVELGRMVSVCLILFSLGFLISGLSNRLTAKTLSSDFENGLIKNKSQHFYSEAYTYMNPELYETDIYAESYLGDFQTQFADAAPIEYLNDPEYPFLHKELKTDVLSPFFETGEKKPNVVIILVEGLGRAFTNKGAYLGNFTPYLDSLSTKSLYWPNFLSNGGRTFAVLPSLLGSLPFSENGYMEMESNMPDQISLLNLLKKNGYQTSFYYGGNSEFDKMASYLRKNRIDRVNDENDFPSGYKKIPASATGFTWGYGDKELFRYYLNSNLKQEQPRLDVLLTVSTHSPFLIDETEKYTQKFEDRMTQFGFSEKKKEDYRNYTKQYTSILFTDDAIKNFIESYKQKDDFENTIFLITGDHRIPEIPMASKIDRYHVPLMIYSPMLKRPAEIESISSHFDIAPSLISFLSNNYDVKAPEINSFVGRGLDTTRSFQNIHHIPLMQTKTDLIDFVLGDYHLNGDDLYKLTRDFNEERVNDPDKVEELKNAFNQFRMKNSEIVNGKKILPDSIIRKYTLN